MEWTNQYNFYQSYLSITQNKRNAPIKQTANLSPTPFPKPYHKYFPEQDTVINKQVSQTQKKDASSRQHKN